MEDEGGYFGERVAASYDDSSEGMFDPALVDTVADVLAGLAGMRLRDRWEGWTREPVTSESRQHVSVWERP
jgi:hypothetical protein